MPVKAQITSIRLYDTEKAYVVPRMDIPSDLVPFIDFERFEKEKAPRHEKAWVGSRIYIIAKEPFDVYVIDEDGHFQIIPSQEIEIPDDIFPFIKESVRKILTE